MEDNNNDFEDDFVMEDEDDGQPLEEENNQQEATDEQVISMEEGDFSNDEPAVEVAEQLEHALESRPSEEQMRNLFKGQKRSSLSNVLSGTAHELEKQMTADALSHALSDREKHDELLSNRGSLSNVLAGTAAELEVSC
jgi:hypothetical protein